MARSEWVVFGLCLLGAVQLGSTVETIPDGVVVTAGNCSLFAFANCAEGSAGCVDLEDDRYYCKCLGDDIGDGRNNGTGCGSIVFSCASDDDCHPNAVCTNDTCVCKSGYERNGSACLDIDECAENPCVPNSICRNSQGYYNCTCKPLFERVDDQCVFRCRVDQDCHDAHGECVDEQCECEPGFEGDGVETCNDINECNGTFECSADAECVNEVGSYRCDCHNGYDGDGKTCVKLPTSCQEIYESNSASATDTYTIDTDGTGPVGPITVRCEMRDGMGITIIYPLEESILQSPDGGAEVPVEYPATPEEIKPLVNSSEFCSQEFWAKCRSRYDLQAFVSWEDVNGNTRTGWGTDQDGMCPCGVLGVCKNPTSACNCDGTNSAREVDAGYIIDKSILPAIKVIFGNTNKNTDWTVGPLKCGPKPIDILKDCSEIRTQEDIKLNGPQLIDVDGPDAPLEPVLVYCDMQTYPNIGVTVITPDGPPDVLFNETATRPVTYSTPMDVIEALLRGSVHCDQSFEYECQDGKQDVTVNVGNDRQLGYLPGGIAEVPGSCGCGVTQTCDELNAPCNCAIDDGQTRKDIGVQINKDDLPIVSVSAEFNGQKTGVSIVGPLRCSSSQFGIEPNCEKYRSLGYDFNYTYLIDPDGPPAADGSDNVVPFRAQCVMNLDPPSGITIIQHGSRDTIRFGNSSWSLEFLYPYVSPEQLAALRSRCTYVRQNVKLSCNEFALHPASDTGFYAYWNGVGSTRKRFYWSGNGTYQNCDANGEDVCQCDSSESSSTTLIDQGDLNNKQHLPLGFVDFEPANVDGGGYVEMELGPFMCFEVFETCAVVFSTAQSRARYGEVLPEDGSFTIDPDGSGEVQAFQVDCDFPFTTLPVVPSQETLDNTGTDPVTQCFDISYLDGVGNTLSQNQVISLVEASNGNCKQSLSLTCSNAPITDLIYFETCGSGRQTGWAGSGGQDSCACGVTGTCEGDVNRKCNCDIEDGTERSDSGTIVDNERLPICKVCITLNGTVSTGGVPAPPRSASFQVSNLVCSKNKLGVNTNCQKASIGSSPEDSGTIYIKAQPEPIPVYCDFRPYPPAGVLKVFPANPNITVPPNEPFDEFIVYKVYQMSQLIPLISDFDYCTQRLEVTCQDASLNIQGQFGWYSRDNVLQNYWVDPQSGGPCSGNGGQCNCNLPGSQSDGGLIIDQSALPVTRIRFEASSGARNIFLGPLECYDIKKDCYEIMRSGDKSTVYWGNSTYVIDADGPGPLDPFLVVCQFDEDNDNAVTIAYPVTRFPKVVTGRDSAPFEIPLSYKGASPEQLNALARNSQFCLQGVLYDCKESPIGNITLADGEQANGFGLADDLISIGCPCGKLGTCGTENLCRCDNMGAMGSYDRGYFTAKDELPVTSASFGGQESSTAVGKLTVSELQCSKKPKDLPKTCAEAAEMGMVTGEILLYPTPDIPPFLVFCDMSIGTGVARVKPVDDPDRPVSGGETDVTYKGLTDEQLTALISVSDYCYQPVLVDCYKAGFISDNYFSWSGPDGTINRYWGNGSPSEQTCTCGAEEMCGGDGGKDEMSRRKCNCDIGDAVWRKDGGVLRIKEHLPVRRYTYNSPGFGADAQANITFGELYCGMEEIDLPVCNMEFDDCIDLAACEEKSISEFECVCPEGYQGHINGQGINDLWANGRQCYDNDECSYFACPYSADCLNLPGDFNCTCKDGYIKTGKTTCQDIDECASPDDNDCDENARCVNTDGSYNCRCNRGYIGDGRTCEAQGQCACFGDPHCLSFDQKWLHFMGLCEYVMSRDSCDGGDPTYEVIIQNWRQERDTTASWVKKVLVKFQGTRIELRQNRQVLVNGELKSAYSSNQLTVADYGREVKLTTNTGLIVTWDGYDAVQVSVGSYYKGNVCGLCGNYNDDESDDWTLGPSCPDTSGPPITTNNNLFGNSWSTSQIGNGDSQCSVDCEAEPSNNPECGMNPVFASMLCNSVLNQGLSIFSSCIPKVDPGIMAGLYATCNEDMCRSPDTSMDNLCDVASRLAIECQNIGEQVPVWQNTNGLRCGGDECGENMVQSFCGGMSTTNPGPVQTCIGLRTNTVPTPSPSCLSGCFCKNNYYLDGDKCVPEDDCGCIYTNPNGETSYMEPGESHVEVGCGTYRVCIGGNVIENETLVCSPNATCRLNNETGIYGCYCNEGFMGDGENCEVDPCGNVNCPDNQECKEGECFCQMGFTADCDNCVDIDECATQTHNCTKLGQICINTPGGYYCSCEEGFINVDGNCLDFDECEHGRDECPAHSECKNTKGGFECLCCAGFRKNNAVCEPDGSGLNLVGARAKCCSCFGHNCDRVGKVCGSNGQTYNSQKELIIKSCKQGVYVTTNYDGPCLDSCDNLECPRPGQLCSIVDGKAKCLCPACEESEYNTTVESVCSSTHLMFRSYCLFDKYRCMMGNSEITITSTGRECEGSGAGMPMGQWTEWSDCSVTCGTGTQSRSRVPIAAALDANGNPLRETAIAVCYRTCPEGPCSETACPPMEVCVEDNSTASGFSCQCPDCIMRGDTPVCGRVGNFVKTYINLCELEKDACLKKLPMTLVQDFPCEAQPRECAKMFLWESRKDNNSCDSLYMDFGQCGGGCGEDPSQCCVPHKEPTSVEVRCRGMQPYNATFDVITSCMCMPQDEVAAYEASDAMENVTTVVPIP